MPGAAAGATVEDVAVEDSKFAEEEAVRLLLLALQPEPLAVAAEAADEKQWRLVIIKPKAGEGKPSVNLSPISTLHDHGSPVKIDRTHSRTISLTAMRRSRKTISGTDNPD